MDRLARLTVNTRGFIFDPTTGDSFTVNATGLFILEGLREEKALETIVQELADAFGVTPEEAEKDLLDFKSQLRSLHLL